jgi:uncharacterized membrane protein YphA (DoxX/SURF4 family)
MLAMLASAGVELAKNTRITIGILLLTLLAVEYGGYFMLQTVRGHQPVTPFQQSFFRAGHPHAGVLVILSIVSLIVADAANVSGPLSFFARNGIWLAAILMPAGFFFSASGRDVKQPNRFIILLYLGIASLSLGVLSLGISLLTS